MGLPIQSTDVITLRSYGSISGTILVASFIIRTPDGKRSDLSIQQTPNSNRTLKQTTFRPVLDGEIIAAVIGSSVAVTRGQLIAELVLQASTIGFAGILVTDYVTDMTPSFPVSGLSASSLGSGIRKTIAISAPANNTDWTFTIPTNSMMRITGIRYQLATAAAGTARQSNLKLTDGTNTIFVFPPQGTQAGGATTTYAWTPVSQNTAAGAGADQIQPLPISSYFLPQNYVISTSTNGIGNTSPDNYTIIFLDVEELILV